MRISILGWKAEASQPYRHVNQPRDGKWHRAHLSPLWALKPSPAHSGEAGGLL
jgi:hypothetical protein